MSGSMPLSSGDSSRLPALMTMAMCVLFFLLGLLLAGRHSSPWEDARIIEGVSAHFRQWKGRETEERLYSLRKGLAAVSTEIAKLANDHVKLSGEKAKERAKDWEVIRQVLEECGVLLRQLEERYSLTPEDGSILREEIRRLARTLAEEQAVQKDKDMKKSSEKSADRKSSPAKKSENEKGAADGPPQKSSEKSR
jgi:hypothetical protein